jgi:hypothetical protein
MDEPVLMAPTIAQELHRSGIPVAIGSPPPLPQPGATTLTRAFHP